MISFIVPAHNEEQLLGRTLASIMHAGRTLGRSFEIVVVDDSSTDRTAAIAQEHGARVVPALCRQIAGSRNAGSRAAAGQMLFFVDADTLVTPSLVLAGVSAMEDGAAGGGCRFRFDGEVPPLGRVLIAVAEPLYSLCRLVAGCFIFCTRTAFEATGGFNEALFAAEEVDMSRRLAKQGRVVLLREAVVTSGRKLRSHSTGEILGLFGRMLVSGPTILRKRDKLGIWYAERRLDPAPDHANLSSVSQSRP